MVLTKQSLWIGEHKDTCKLKDEAGFHDVTRPGKGRIFKQKCSECKNPFIHQRVSFDTHSPRNKTKIKDLD